jgi:hypothetical protein
MGATNDTILGSLKTNPKNVGIKNFRFLNRKYVGG